MKIAIPTDKPSIDGALFNKFGRAPYFLLYDTESKVIKFIENKSISSVSGAGSQTAQLLIRERINVVVIDIIGPKAENVIKKAGITIIEGIKGSVKENLENFDTLTV